MPTIYTQADSNTRETWFLLTGFLVFIIAIGWLFSYIENNNAILYSWIMFGVSIIFIIICLIIIKTKK